MTATRPRVVPENWRRPSTALHVSGLALVFVSIGLVAAALVEIVDGGDEAMALLATAAGGFVVGLGTWQGSRLPDRVPAVQAFAAVTWTWLSVSLLGAVAFVATGTLTRPDDAFFESMSGFSCSGSTVLADIEAAGAGILFFRNLTQWFGGMGLIVLAVAVLPLLRVGGLELIRAEAPGPTADRLAPRVSETAKRLWLLYAGLTVVNTLAFLAVGMSPFDASTHAFTTMSTGGFSPRNLSIGHYDSTAVELVTVLFMVVGGASFTLHWLAIVRRRPAVWIRSAELRLYLAIMVGAIGLVFLLHLPDGAGAATTLRDSVFNVVTVVTSCGFGTADFTTWAAGAQLVLLVLMVPAGMTGSTSGGVKILRIQVLVRHALREVTRSRHRTARLPIRLAREPIPEAVVARVVGFVVIYLTLMLAGGLLVTALGADPVTGFTGATSAIGNIGPALGEAGPASNFLVYPRPARMVLATLMLIGRLEVFPVLFALHPLIRRR